LVCKIKKNRKEMKKSGKKEIEVEVAHAATMLTYQIICDAAFGVTAREDDSTHTTLFSAVRKISQAGPLLAAPSIGLFVTWYLKEVLNTVHENMNQVLKSAYQAKDDPGNDTTVLNLMLNANFTDGEIKDEAIVFLLAGNETTAVTLTWILVRLAKHPEYQAKIREEVQKVLGDKMPDFDNTDDLTFTRAVIHETLRTAAPTAVVTRTVVNPAHLSGYDLPVGVTVWLVPMVISDNEWENPAHFNPYRFIKEDGTFDANPGLFAKFPAFGLGERKCIAQKFALVELAITLAMLLKEYKFTTKNEYVPEFLSITSPPKGEKVFMDIKHWDD